MFKLFEYNEKSKLEISDSYIKNYFKILNLLGINFIKTKPNFFSFIRFKIKHEIPIYRKIENEIIFLFKKIIFFPTQLQKIIWNKITGFIFSKNYSE